MRVSKAHIAGVGLTECTQASLDDSAISAGTKALLDAGITYTDVDTSIACFLDDERISQSCFAQLGMHGAAVSEIDNRSGLFAAIQGVKSGQSGCTLVIGLDKMFSTGALALRSCAVATVLVSDLFLTSHAYLKDSAVCVLGSSLATGVYSRSKGVLNHPCTIKKAVKAALRHAELAPNDIHALYVRNSSDGDGRLLLGAEFDFTPHEDMQPASGTTGFRGVVGIVWQLRGWTGDPPARILNSLQAVLNADGSMSVLVLCRSDDRPARAATEAVNLRDGRERLGYNPSTGSQDISQEDLEAVRAREEFTQDNVRQLQLRIKGGDRAALARL